MEKRGWVIAASCLVGVCVVSTGGAIFSFVQATESRRGAEELLRSFGTLQVGITSVPAAAHVTAAFQEHRSDEIVNGNTEWTFAYDNYLMSQFRLSPYASMDAILVFRSGVLQKKAIHAFVASGIAASVEERMAGFGFPAGDVSDQGPRHRLRFTRNSDTAFRSIIISNNNLLDAKKRQEDWRIDLSYLNKLGGYTDARVIIRNIEAQIMNDNSTVVPR